MYATLAMGKSSHKDVTSHSFIVRFYYQHRLFMGFCCICVEALYLFLYLMAFKEFRGAAAPVTLPRAAMHVLEGWDMLTTRGDVPVLGLLSALALPGFCIKQMVNVSQLRTAAAQLVELDEMKPRKRRQTRL